MRFVWIVLLAWMAATSSSEVVGSEQPDVTRLIEQLAAPEFEVRENAQRQLIELGAVAKPALERALKSPDVEQRLRVQHILAELRREESWEPSLVRLQQVDAPALDVFRAIAEQTKNPVNWNRSAKSLDARVTVNWAGVPYWQAMDELCRQAQAVVAAYTDPAYSGLVINKGGPEQYPTAYHGPTRMRLTALDRMLNQRLNYGDGVLEQQENVSLSFMLHWEQRLALCRYMGRPIVAEALTDAGESLQPKSQMALTLMQLSRGQRHLTFQCRLDPPRKPAKRLTRLRLQLDLVAADSFATLEINGLEPMRTVEVDGYTLEHVETKQLADRWQITLRLTRPKPHDKFNSPTAVDEFLEITNAAGEAIGFHLVKVVGDENTVMYVVHVLKRPDGPVGLRFNVARTLHRRRAEYVFRDVPLISASP
jgi:hypothetical protein